MVDVELRTLQRSNDPEDQAQALRVKVRSRTLKLIGTKTPSFNCGVPCGGCHLTVRPCLCQLQHSTKETLELLAYCGHAGARLLLEWTPCPGSNYYPTMVDWGFGGWYTTFVRWADGLERWGREIVVRAAIAVARMTLQHRQPQQMCGDARCCKPGHKGPCQNPRWLRIHAIINATQAWVDDQSEENAKAIKTILDIPMYIDWVDSLRVLAAHTHVILTKELTRLITSAIKITDRDTVHKAICNEMIRVYG